MNTLPSASRLSSHGALMDPGYLRDAMSSHPTEDSKSELLVRAAIVLALCIPAVLWLGGRAA